MERGLLRRRHIVMLASREESVVQVVEEAEEAEEAGIVM
jgi:hypothetical protein